MAKKVGIGIMILTTFFAVYLYSKYDPETMFFPKCPFLWVTGLKCPGCGIQRAIHQFLNLNFNAAFHYNACLVLFIPVIIFLSLATLLRDKYPKLYLASHHCILSWCVPVIILLWWIIRNCFGL